ncbi:MAG: mycolate reductase [Acidobacteriota bacterium]
MQVAVVTGASSGIGRAAAEAFAGRGYGLFLVARRQDRLKEVAQRCRSAGSPRVEFSPHDLSVPGEGTALVREALERFGQIDVLVCNAGYGYWGPMEEVPPEAMRRMMEVNFHSAYESIYAALPHFKERRSGHILLVSSVIGRRGMPYSSAYCATKFAQAGLAESLWGELKSAGIGVSLICPGYTDTEFHDVASPQHRRVRPLRGQDPRRVGEAMVRAVERKKPFVHLTFLGKLLVVSNRLSPRLTGYIMAAVARSQLEKKTRP